LQSYLIAHAQDPPARVSRFVRIARFYRMNGRAQSMPAADLPGEQAWLDLGAGSLAPPPLSSVAPEESMSYVNTVLQPGEEIRHSSSIHWIVYWPGILMLLAALAVFVVAERSDSQGMRYFWLACAGIIAVIAIVQLAREWWVWWTTEICVTNRRIIFKQGFISRRTFEMHMDKVESVDVDQSVLGRVLNYGSVIVKGTGTGFEPLETVAAPIDLRNHITGV
jgi:Bacterial PH domain